MNSPTSKLALPFDHLEAHAHLSKIDKRLAGLIERVGEFQFKLDECESVYESLLEAITHQSIAGKAAQVIFARIVALGTDGRCPTPQELLLVRKPNNFSACGNRFCARPACPAQKLPPSEISRRKRSTASCPRSKLPKKCRIRSWLTG